jgi:hypothetical protein
VNLVEFGFGGLVGFELVVSWWRLDLVEFSWLVGWVVRFDLVEFGLVGLIWLNLNLVVGWLNLVGW